MARVLHLTNDQFGALYDIVKDAVDYIEGDLITTEDENGNEVLEDINEYEIYQVFQQLRLLNNEIDHPKVTVTPQQLEGDISTVKDSDYADKVDTLVSKMAASDDKEFTHDSEGC